MALVVYCKPKEERRAFKNLNAQGFKCFLPLCRKSATSSETFPLFPRYLFIWVPEGHAWRPILNTPGVGYILKNSDYSPSIISDNIIESIQYRMDEDGGAILLRQERETRKSFKNGQKIRIIGGAHIGCDGFYVSRTKDRIIALLNMFGRKVRATIPEKHVA